MIYLKINNGHFRTRSKNALLTASPIKHAVRQVRKHLWLLAGSRDHEDINSFIRKERYQDLVRDLMDDFTETLSPAPSFEERFGWWNQSRVGMSVFLLEPTTVEEFRCHRTLWTM